MKTIEQLREFFKNDRFATENGAVIDDVGLDYARCSLLPDARHRNAAGGIMGGALFTLADFAFAVAANAEELGTVSISASISFIGTMRGTRLIAEAKCVKDGRTTCLYSVHITDDTSTPIAEVMITGFHTKKEK